MFDEVVDEVVEETPEGDFSAPAALVDVRPKPDFVHTVGDREVGFRTPIRGQLVALSRVRESVSRQLDAISRKADKSDEDFAKVNRLVLDAELATLEVVESLVLDPDDLEHMRVALLRGQIEVDDILSVLYGGKDKPDDDVPRKPKAAKKVANAKRARR